MNRLGLSLAAVALLAVGWFFGHQRGLSDAPSAHAAEAARIERDAEWDAAFWEEVKATPDARDLFCEGVIDDARRLLDDEALLEQAERAAMPNMRD